MPHFNRVCPPIDFNVTIKQEMPNNKQTEAGKSRKYCSGTDLKSGYDRP